MSHRALTAFAVVLASAATASPRLELEVGAGATTLTEISPTFTGRIGVDLMDWLTPSLRVISVTPLSAQAMGWGVLAELRAHTSGVVQLTGGVALGIASASFTAPSRGGVETQINGVTPSLWADLGLRVTLGPFWIGASVGGAPVSWQLMGLVNIGVAVFGD